MSFSATSDKYLMPARLQRQQLSSRTNVDLGRKHEQQVMLAASLVRPLKGYRYMTNGHV